MIISRRYRYVFVEVPFTGSTAISRELRELYDGEPVLHKHASLAEFLGTAGSDERRYFTFAAVRHPLDIAVSEYFKLKTNHKGRYTDPRRLGTPALTSRHLEQFEFVHHEHASFEQFFNRFCSSVYNNHYLVLHEKFDAIIRFERLADDFGDVLARLGIEQVRSLPSVNRTGEKDVNFWSYYPPALWPIAQSMYGPFMRRWNYSFPPEWGEVRVPFSSELRFRSINLIVNAAARVLHVGPNSRSPLMNRAREVIRAVWS